jgi:signal transduction histidine kinase
MSGSDPGMGLDDPLSRTVVPLSSSGHYTSVGEAAPPGRPPKRRGATVRTKLTVLYGGSFVVAGVALMAVLYAVVLWLVNHPRADMPPACAEAARRAAYAQAQGEIATAKALTTYEIGCVRLVRSETLHQTLVACLLCLLVFGLLVFAVGYWLAGRVLRPLSRITLAARRIAQQPAGALRGSEFSRRIAMEGPSDELRELADTFDEMLDRLDSAFESQRRFTGNASHELRTPLAINRTLLEVALADPDTTADTATLINSLLRTNERSERMIEGLLALASADNALVEAGPVDLGMIAERTTSLCAAEAAGVGVSLRTDLRPVVVAGDATLLERVATNLVQNALRYNVPGGWVDVVTYDQERYGLLVVANSGPVVPESLVESLFEPFRRLPVEGAVHNPKDRGAGLGLSIVRSVAAAHRGRIAVQPRQDGGLVVRVWIPTRPGRS